MPATDALQPPLAPDERQVVKEYGGWTEFNLSFGLKPWETDDAEEALAIVRGFTNVDADSEKTSPAQEFETNDSAAYEPETEDYEADNSQSDSYQSDHYQSDHYQSDNYQSDSYQSDSYQSDSYQSDSYQSENYQSDSYQSDSYEDYDY